MFLTIKLCTHAKLNCLKLNYLHKMDLALNNLQRLICNITQPINQPLSAKLCILISDKEIDQGNLIGLKFGRWREGMSSIPKKKKKSVSK